MTPKKADSVRGQHLEKGQHNEKVSHFNSFSSEGKPKSVPCRTAKRPTEYCRISGLKNQGTDSGPPPQKENERGSLE